jgi:hypothetical protein
MMVDTGSGLFGLSIDFTSDSLQSLQRELSQLLTTLKRVQIPATFSTPTPGNEVLIEQLRSGTLSHEVAILADSSWVGTHISRTHFARELTQRVQAASANGVQVHTIALADAELTQNLDLLVKNHISVVRTRLHSGVVRSGVEAQLLRFGVWQAPISFTVPTTGRRPFGGTEWAISRVLTRATHQQGFVHLVVDLEVLKNRTEMASLEQILATVQRRQKKGLIETVTMQGLVMRLAPQRQTSSACSVLRAA